MIMSTPKTKKCVPWIECDKCGSFILNKDLETHVSQSCLIDSNCSTHHIKNETLIGELDLKKDLKIKGLNSADLETFVFLSQSVIQLCNLSIGQWVMIEVENFIPFAMKVWPTTEKNLTSVLLTAPAMEVQFGYNISCEVSLKKFTSALRPADRIEITLITKTNILDEQSLLSRLKLSQRGRIICEGNKIGVFYFGKSLKFQIKSIREEINGLDEHLRSLTILSNTFFEVTDKTHWVLSGKYGQEKEVKKFDSLSMIGGLKEEIMEIQELMLYVHNMDKNFINGSYTKSVLLFGNSGTGKTMLANALAQQSKCHVISLSAPHLYSKYLTSPEETIKKVFQEATEYSPSVIVVDEVDLICNSRASRNDTEKRIASTLLICLDELYANSESKVFIIGTTNKIESIDPCFRRCRRFEREIEIPTPSQKSRTEILGKLLKDVNHSINEEQMQFISSNTHGFVGADLLALVSRAVLYATRNDKRELELSDFESAIGKVTPSAMREVQVEIPTVKWSDIAGQQKLILNLKQAVEWPLKHAECFVRLGITPPRGVLMYGPPGCSKTMVAKALATESKLNFISIKGPELFSKWVGESERAVREVFRKARQVAPSIVFFDEIDALGGERSSGSATNVQERVLAQLLTELDGVTPLGNVMILAATNRPDRIDKALLRPGRLDRIVYVSLPDECTRRDIFRLKLQKMPTEEIDIDELVKKTNNYSGAELVAVCHEAAMKALEENIDAQIITMRHFEDALQMITPRTPASLIELYENYSSN